MASIPQTKRTLVGTVRFGAFELDLQSGELRRLGRLVSLQDQQTVVLKYLVERAGVTVTREELRTRIWAEGTYVEFETGLYNTINRLRRSLGDSASNPHFIETVPKEGYRFIAAVEHPQIEDDAGVSAASALPEVSAIDSGPARQSLATRVGAAIPRRLRFCVGAAGLLLLGAVLGALVWRFHSQTSAQDQIYRYAIPVAGLEGISSLAISPAGDQVVFEGANRLLWRRYLDRNDPRPIPGSEGGQSPFFSPDGQSVGFFAANALMIAEGKRVRQLAVLPHKYATCNATWADDGFIYFNSGMGDAQGIWRIPSRGGRSELVIGSTYSGRGVVIPLVNQVLTRPRHLLIYSTNSGPLRRSLHVRDLEKLRDKLIVERGVGGHILPDGHLIYYNHGSLFAAGFDPQKLQIQGTPVEMVKDVAPYSWQSALAGVSNNGTLAYVMPGEPEFKTLEWVGGNGEITPLPLPPDRYEQAEVSPRGNLLAIVRREGLDRFSLSTYNLRNAEWHHILDSDASRLRAQWSPDGTALVVSLARQNEDFTNLYRVPLANPGDAQRLTEEPDYGQFPLSWSAKADAILFMEGVHERTNGDLMVLPSSGKGQTKPLVATPGWDRSASFSPDGQWFVYESDEQGQPEIFVRRYDAAKAEASNLSVKISGHGGTDPVWAPDGRSVYYSDPSRQLVQVMLSRDAIPLSSRTVAASVPGMKDLWTRTCSMAPDGRLLFLRPVVRTPQPPEIQVVVNWAAEVKRFSPMP